MEEPFKFKKWDLAAVRIAILESTLLIQQVRIKTILLILRSPTMRSSRSSESADRAKAS